MISAQEAYKATKKTIANMDTEEMKLIKECIISAVKNGEYEITLARNFSIITHEMLTRLGYIVTNPTSYTTKINWFKV